MSRHGRRLIFVYNYSWLRASFFFFLWIGRPPRSPLFPYTPLSRSPRGLRAARGEPAQPPRGACTSRPFVERPLVFPPLPCSPRGNGGATDRVSSTRFHESPGAFPSSIVAARAGWLRLGARTAHKPHGAEIGRASCRERV